MTLSLIVAVSKNGFIGKNGSRWKKFSLEKKKKSILTGKKYFSLDDKVNFHGNNQLSEEIKAKPDDLLDSLVLCWSASRHIQKKGIYLGLKNSSKTFNESESLIHV